MKRPGKVGSIPACGADPTHRRRDSAGKADNVPLSASAARMGPSPPLRLSVGDSTPSPAALMIIVITIGSSLDRDLHGQEVICRHGFASIFISRRHRRRFRFKINWDLARSSSPCLASLSLDLTNYGNSFSRVRTRGWGRESAAQGNSGGGERCQEHQ